MRERTRGLVFASAGALLAGYILLGFNQGIALGGTDFDPVWYAARRYLAGEEPYVAAAPPRFYFPLLYPFPAVLVALPFAELGLRAGRLAFVALSGGLFGYALGRYRPWTWPTFFGLPFILSASLAQWSAILTAALFLPWLGPVLAAKPNLALAILAGARSRRAAIILLAGALALTLVSLAIEPEWPTRWRDALAQSTHFRPLLMRPGGVLMLLALLRWRDADARLLLGLAAMPTTGLYYDMLPAAMVARTRTESALLAGCTLVAWFAHPSFPVTSPYEVWSWKAGTLTLWSSLVPPLIIVLRRGRARVEREEAHPAGDPAPRR
jgi:hypothetical protein